MLAFEGKRVVMEGGKPVRVLGISTDITARKRTETALQESEDRFRYALETSHTGAWSLSLKDHTASRSLEHDRIFGYQELLPLPRRVDELMTCIRTCISCPDQHLTLQSV